MHICKKEKKKAHHSQISIERTTAKNSHSFQNIQHMCNEGIAQVSYIDCKQLGLYCVLFCSVYWRDRQMCSRCIARLLWSYSNRTPAVGNIRALEMLQTGRNVLRFTRSECFCIAMEMTAKAITALCAILWSGSKWPTATEGQTKNGNRQHNV